MLNRNITKLLTPIIEIRDRNLNKRQLETKLNSIIDFCKQHKRYENLGITPQIAIVNLLEMTHFSNDFEKTNYIYESLILDGLLSMEFRTSKRAFNNIFHTEDSSAFFIIKSTVETITEMQMARIKTFRHILSIYNCLCYHIKKYYYKHPFMYREFVEYMCVILLYLLSELKLVAKI